MQSVVLKRPVSRRKYEVSEPGVSAGPTPAEKRPTQQVDQSKACVWGGGDMRSAYAQESPCTAGAAVDGTVVDPRGQ